MTQNRSNAVMATRIEPVDSLDDFPTPPWSTRALVMKLEQRGVLLEHMSVLEPSANRGFMARPLAETGCKLTAYDIHDYGAGYPVADFFDETRQFDFVITNPPFNKAAAFLAKARSLVYHDAYVLGGVALLCRTVFGESVGRYKTIFSVNRPSAIFQFTERVPMVKGRCDKRASTATSYAWFWWSGPKSNRFTEYDWIEPCRKKLERDSDYEIPGAPSFAKVAAAG